MSEKWSVVGQVFRYGDFTTEEKWAFYDKLSEEDKSDEAVKRKMLYKACLVSDEDREALFNSFLDPENKASNRE